MKILISSLIASIFLLACSSQPTQNSEEKISAALDQLEMQPSQQPVRIRDYQVDSWRYIDRYNLIIEAGFDDQYLVSLQRPCFQLQSAFAIGFTSSAGSLDKFEDIVVRDSFGRAERCPISEIVKLQKIPQVSTTEE